MDNEKYEKQLDNLRNQVHNMDKAMTLLTQRFDVVNDILTDIRKHMEVFQIFRHETEYYYKIKEASLDKLLKWFKILAFIGPVLLLILPYLTYEQGLSKESHSYLVKQ